MLRIVPHVLVMMAAAAVAYWLTRSGTVAAISAAVALCAMLVLGIMI